MKTSVVIGVGFGDEGKGLVTSALALQEPNSIVIRFGGGHQCGHNVVRNDGTSHVFSNFGSGSMYGIPTYWSKFCTIDPLGMKIEYDILKRKGITPKLIIDPMAMVTTPFDITWNIFRNNQNHHGSCGVGFGATIKRNERNYHLNAMDILYPQIFIQKLDLIKKDLGDDFFEEFYNKLEYHPLEFMEAVEWLRECPDIQIKPINVYLYNHLIFEGHQGIMLDKDFGFFPHVTNSNTTIKNIIDLGYYSSTVYYVTRAYQTRHGNGPMSNYDKKINLINNRAETNVHNKHQGKFRTGILDMNLVKYAVDCNRAINKPLKEKLVVTCVDQLESKWSFTQNGSIYKQDIDGNIWENTLRIKDVFFSHSPVTESLKLCKTFTLPTISYGL